MITIKVLNSNNFEYNGIVYPTGYKAIRGRDNTIDIVSAFGYQNLVTGLSLDDVTVLDGDGVALAAAGSDLNTLLAAINDVVNFRTAGVSASSTPSSPLTTRTVIFDFNSATVSGNDASFDLSTDVAVLTDGRVRIFKFDAGDSGAVTEITSISEGKFQLDKNASYTVASQHQYKTAAEAYKQPYEWVVLARFKVEDDDSLTSITGGYPIQYRGLVALDELKESDINGIIFNTTTQYDTYKLQVSAVKKEVTEKNIYLAQSVFDAYLNGISEAFDTAKKTQDKIIANTELMGDTKDDLLDELGDLNDTVNSNKTQIGKNKTSVEENTKSIATIKGKSVLLLIQEELFTGLEYFNGVRKHTMYKSIPSGAIIKVLMLATDGVTQFSIDFVARKSGSKGGAYYEGHHTAKIDRIGGAVIEIEVSTSTNCQLEGIQVYEKVTI